MNKYKRYDEEFKQSIVNLYHSGKSQLQLSKDYGAAPSTIGKWIKQYSEVQIDEETILTAKQIKNLQKRNAQLEEENLILKKSRCHIHAGLEERLRAVNILKYQHRIVTLCRVLKVNRSTYYRHLKHNPSKRSLENDRISSLIIKIYLDSKKRFGAHKIKYVLECEWHKNKRW